MSTEDIIYLILLFGSIPFGHLVKNAGDAAKKQLLCLTAGLVIAFITVHIEIWYSFITVVGNFVLVKSVGPRHCPLICSIYVFGCLFLLRTATWYGLPVPSDHCNAIQLLVTLRMVSLAFEVQQSYLDALKSKDENKETEKDNTQANKLKYLDPSIYDYLAYGYCYIGLMTGPFYTYKVFHDMLNQDATNISTVIPTLRRLKYLPMYIVPYLILNINFPIQYMNTDEFLNHPWGLIYQWAYLAPTYHWFQWRFYIGWLLAEAMCITAGLGAYPFDTYPKPGLGPSKPLDGKYDIEKAKKEHDGDTHSFETIHNIDIYNVEFAPTMRLAMKSWNMTVQWWMAMYVYRKLPYRKFRMTTVLFVSAFWHGVHPGYYLTFLSVSMVVFAESRMLTAIKPYLVDSPRLQYVVDWITWFCLYRSFEYLGVGFMMLKIESIWRVWRQMYFIGHIFIISFWIIPFFIPKKRSPKTDDQKYESSKLDEKIKSS